MDRKNRNRSRLERGFSLVELMVVIAIIGLLSTIVAVNVLKSGAKARKEKVKADIKAISDAIMIMYNDTGMMPQALEELVNGSVEDWNGPYIVGGMKALRDPWKREYVYIYDGAGDPPFLLGSYGQDGGPGGENDAEDIFNRDDQAGF
jgi:general secretion pathway protein G